jgi:hypothetical protein
MADPILDLSTILPDRDSVRIDGHPYEIARQDDLSLEQRRDVNKTWSRLLEIEQKEEFTPTDETEYSDLVQKLTNLVLIDCPRHIVKKLPRSFWVFSVSRRIRGW